MSSFNDQVLGAAYRLFHQTGYPVSDSDIARQVGEGDVSRVTETLRQLADDSYLLLEPGLGGRENVSGITRKGERRARDS